MIYVSFNKKSYTQYILCGKSTEHLSAQRKKLQNGARLGRRGRVIPNCVVTSFFSYTISAFFEPFYHSMHKLTYKLFREIDWRLHHKMLFKNALIYFHFLLLYIESFLIVLPDKSYSSIEKNVAIFYRDCRLLNHIHFFSNDFLSAYVFL